MISREDLKISKSLRLGLYLLDSMGQIIKIASSSASNILDVSDRDLNIIKYYKAQFIKVRNNKISRKLYENKRFIEYKNYLLVFEGEPVYVE